MVRLTCNTENSFTIHLNQTSISLEDYGTHLLKISNPFGRTTVFLSVIPQSKQMKQRFISNQLRSIRHVCKLYLMVNLVHTRSLTCTQRQTIYIYLKQLFKHFAVLQKYSCTVRSISSYRYSPTTNEDMQQICFCTHK